MTAILFAKIGHSSEGLKTLTTILKRRTLDNMAVPATGKKASDAAAAAATLEAAQAAERLEREAADAAAAADVLKAQQEAEEEAARLQKQQAEDELDIVAVGAVAHVIRRAFRSFYEPEEPTPVNTGRSEAADEQAAVGDAASESESQVEAEGDAKEQEQVQTDTQEVAADTGRKEQWTARDEMLQREESPFVAIAQARKDAIAAELAKKHEQARALLKFMEQRQQDAAEADARIANELNQKGLVIKAQIPVGPTSLRLDEQELRAAAEAGNDFGEFADSLLHAKTLVAEYEKTRLERSGNVAKAWSPSRRTAAGEGSSEAGDHVGYLNTTSSSNIRKDATLKYHKNNIASVKSKHEEYRAANTTTDTIPGDEIAHEVEQDEENIFPPVTTTPSLLPETQQEQPQRPELVMKAVEKRKNMAILDRMQTKLDFMRNPRFAAPEQMQATKSKPSKDHGSTGIQSNGVTPICFDVIPKPPIMFTDYDIGGLYEQVVYVRNRSDLSRRIRILPPGTTFFSMARILYPEASGMIAPGLNVELRIRFAPDSRADYKDSFTVQFETEQIGSGTPGSAGSGEIVVPLMGRREPPELTLPLVVHAQNTLVGGRSTTPLMCTNLGGKARFWLMSEHAWSQLEYLQVVCPGTSSVRSAVGLLGSDQQQRASLEVGPFHLTPNEIELDKGESVTFDLVYTPTGVGEQRERFVMVCDNCLVRVFQVVGRGCQVDIAATRVNDSPIDTNVAEMGPLDHMIFPNEILVNGQAQQTIVITNDTPLDVKYTWKIHPLLLDPRDKMNEGGKDKVTMLPVPPDWRPPFRVVPDSGVFALSSSKEFTVEFLPTESRTYECQVTLMINDIPACSMPGPGQMEHLKAAFKVHEGTALTPRVAAARKLQDSMPGYSLQLHGRGRLGSFAIAPELSDSWIPIQDDDTQQPGTSGCEAEQMLLQKRRYSASVILKNQCDASIGFRWDLARLRQRHLAAVGGPSTSTLISAVKNQPPCFELTMSPLIGDLAPLGCQKVEIVFTPFCTGDFSLSVPCVNTSSNDSQSSGFERWLLLEGHVAKAEIEIVTREVDFGLVLVGASAETSITIRNPSHSVATSWRLLHLDGSPGGDEPGLMPRRQSQFSQASKLRRSSSKESIASRHSTISSGSGNETERSLFTARDILPRATVAFAPENGLLAPGETFTAKVTCLAGSLPERFRGIFSCQAAPERLFVGTDTKGAQAAVSARAEIQSPNVFLSTTRLPLGTTYLGVEVRRTIDLVNVSNLEAAFKFVEPEGASKVYTVSFSPRQGTIHCKERLEVTVSYTPRQLGKSTAVFACSVRGLAAPLGFEVTSNHKGLVLSYELLPGSNAAKLGSQKDYQPVDTSSVALPKSPKEIALERGIPLSDCDLEPDSNPLSNVPKLGFGDSVPLGDRRSLYLLIRNFSGIEALVDLEAKKFPVAEMLASTLTTTINSSGVAASIENPTRQIGNQFSSSPTMSPISRIKNTNNSSPRSSTKNTSLGSTKAGLSDSNDDGFRFQTENGRTYLRQSAENLENKHMLRAGHGVAFQLVPDRVHIPPWEQVVVRVTCFNNMPGSYVDDIVSRAKGTPPVFLHANVGVVGTPLTLDRNCVGLHFGKPVPAGRVQQLPREPTLRFGAVCVRAASITRTLRVTNRGPQCARLKWKLVENGREDHLVTVTLRVDFGSRLQLRITPCDDEGHDATALPFKVDPPKAIVPAFSTTPFRITFEPPKDGVAEPRALLLADAHWYDANLDGKSGSAEIEDSTVHDSRDPRQEDPASPSSPGSNNSSGAAHAVAAGKAFAAVRLANAMVRKVKDPSIPASSFSPKCLRVLLTADVIEPELTIDKPKEQLQQYGTSQLSQSARSSVNRSATPRITSPPLLVPYHIKFTTWSTLMSKTAARHAFHQREVFLVNRLESRVTFRLECDGPFAVAQADSLAPRHPLSIADLPPAHRRSTAQGESYMFMLPPQMSVRIDLRFIPSPSLVTNSSSTSSSSSSKPKQLVQEQQQPLHSRLDGELRVKFATRSTQVIRLAAVVLRPAVLVSPSVFCFGRVHLSVSRLVVLRLANPTVVPAHFVVQHVPRPKPVSRAQQQEMSKHHAHLTDDPDVFTFSSRSGELRGPTTTLKSAGGWLPTMDSTKDLLGEKATTTHPLVHAPLELRVEFHPRQSGRHYKSRFRFVVEHGRDFEVVLEGVSHLDEVDNPRDADRPLVRVKELQHSYHIFRGSSPHANLHKQT